ncbi:EscU/YscU/HrcU family type III secretion system export apparatus switch protein [Variovorax saccharolyticus]|uniref:EscU/YscU/HrcU family type III secretion system export apparatus switch protein n=1 Tax=Variovorax saccharolyticus TaxID=3053516 RepID=UPI0025791019|nr:EscU/YscU/HrcU family type III secretion system export apparatus switch protein [Variovorax sp. J31P216]MDM0030164.1 EscU/YscU/HrcU family type III secretion system export apparatus switch protein [Variovorax sp. J31P216]
MTQQEKTLQPSQQKLNKAREDGDVGKSREFAKALSFLTVVVAGIVGGGAFYQGWVTLLDFVAALAYRPVETVFPPLFSAAVWAVVHGSAIPLAAICGIVIICDVAATRGILFAAKKVTPSLENISPLKQIKNWFSLRNLMDLTKNLLKIAVLGFVCVKLLLSNLNTLLWSAGSTPEIFLGVAGGLLSSIFVTCAVIYCIISVVDIWLQRKIFSRSQMMSRQERTDETTKSEGKPEIKQKRTSLHMDLMNGGVRNVKEATVVVTNPVHLAVALRYVEDEMSLPTVVAMGSEALARSIREEAALYSVPVVEDISLARALWRGCKVGDFVPQGLTEAVAAVLVAIERVADGSDAYPPHDPS